MHGKTVADLLTELEDVREEWKEALDQQLREMTDRLDGLV
jgi:predicted RNase H-like HicB family nuclease